MTEVAGMKKERVGVKEKLRAELVDDDDTLRWDVGDGGFFKGPANPWNQV
jgi:hypothetical protein